MNVLTLPPAPDSVTKLIQLDEGPQVEFTNAIPSVTALAQIISAFANTEGGVVLVGVSKEAPQIRGINWEQMGRVFDRATETLKNIDNTTLHQVRVNEKYVGYIIVKKSPTIVIGPAGADRRVKDKIQPLTAQQLAAQIPAQGPPGGLEPLIQAIAALTDTVNNQTGTIEGLQAQVAVAQSFRGQWLGWLISFLIGCITGVIGNLITAAITRGG